jgi:hypothetical protein
LVNLPNSTSNSPKLELNKDSEDVIYDNIAVLRSQEKSKFTYDSPAKIVSENTCVVVYNDTNDTDNVLVNSINSVARIVIGMLIMYFILYLYLIFYVNIYILFIFNILC